MKYDIAVLERMVAHYTMNIEMFQKMQSNGNALVTDIADMVANRRLIASFIENDGERTVPPGFRRGDVFFDTTLYAVSNGERIYSN